jgi:protein XagA
MRCRFLEAEMRRHIKSIALIAALVFQADAAFAGAWTQAEGTAQIISSAILSRAGRGFDDSGKADQPISYSKYLAQTYIAYGLFDGVTLLLDPEYATARLGPKGGPAMSANALAIGAGVQGRILDDEFGVLSVEGAFKSAGAFDTNVSVNKQSGQQYELRALYGTNFPVFDKTAFVDLELGERWIAGTRPNETPIDLAVGLHITKGLMVLAQNFNVIAGGDAAPPYTYYRSHKVELSVVQHIWHHYSLQAGFFISPAGQNSLKEQGIAVALWDDL